MGKKIRFKGISPARHWLRRQALAGGPYYILLGVTVLLLLFGTVMIFSGSFATSYLYQKDSFYYLKRHLIAIFLGLLALYFFSRFDYRQLKKLSLPLMAFSLSLLILVLVPGIGKIAGGSSRWLSLYFFNFQPSELAKVAFVIYAAHLFSRKGRNLKNPQELFFPLSIWLGLFLALLLLQPHFGTAVIVTITFFVLAFLSGAKKRHLLALSSLGLLAFFFFIFSAEYRFRRLVAFLNPWADPQDKGFQIIQSLLAFGSGGITGVGLGMSRQKFLYLPAAHTDFILSIIGEELGLLGTLATVFLFLALAYAGFKISSQAKDRFGQLLAAGLTSLILLQVIINMAAVTGLLPVTGIPLPFLSFGGSSLVFSLSAIGILLNISTLKSKKEKVKKDESDNLWRWNRRPSLSRPRSSQRAYL